MDITTKIKMLWKANRREARFVLLFLLFFLVLHGIHYLTRPYTEPLLVNKLTAGVSGTLINLVVPSEKVVVSRNIIGSSGGQISIASGCDGTDGLLVVWAAVLAFEMALKWKIIGLVLGSLVVYATNLLRIILLYYTYHYHNALFSIMHTYIGQFMVIVAGLAFFIFWIGYVRRDNVRTA